MSVDCLVLDSNYRPRDFTSWQNAIKLMWEDRARVVKEDNNIKLHSQHFVCGMPRVIVVKNSWTRRKREMIPLSRRNVYLRDNGECQYCGNKLNLAEYTIDHVMPQCKGGQDTWENLVLCCRFCNRQKAGYTLSDSGMKLINIPKKPKIGDPRFNFKLHVYHLRPEWKDWSEFLYYTVSN
jgi:5-methylcytosine-specific restriction endonuclease McrA